MKVYLYYTDTYENIFEIYSEEGIKKVKENVLLPEAHKMRNKITESFNMNIVEFTKRKKSCIKEEQELLEASRSLDKHTPEYKQNKKDRKGLLRTIEDYNQSIYTSKKRIEAVNFSTDEDLINWYLDFTRQKIEERYVLNQA